MSKTEKIGIVTFAFGAPGDIKSNKLLGIFTSTEANNLGAPVYTQADIHVKEYVEDLVRIPEEPGNPPSTLQIARGAVQWAIQGDLDTLLVIAAQPHLERALRDLAYAIREKDVDIEIKISDWMRERIFSLERTWYCSDSTQKHTQNRNNWRRRENVLQLMPMSLYKRITG